MNETEPKYPELEPLKALLVEPLDVENPTLMASQLVQIEAWQSLVSVRYREAEQELSRMKGMMFDTSLSSEDKRKIDLEHKVRVPQLYVNLLSDMADIIRRRISLGQTLLKSAKAEIESGLR